MDRNSFLIIGLLLAFLVLGYFLLAAGEIKLSPTGLFGTGQQPKQEEGETQVEKRDENEVIVNLINDQFEPARIQVKPGATINWVNKDQYLHTVTGFGVDEQLQQGQSYQYTFEKEGNYSYRCTIHQGMTGEIVVSE